MNITNQPKALIVLVAMICITVLMAIGNTDYQQYLTWLAEGNTAEEWNPTDDL